VTARRPQARDLDGRRCQALQKFRGDGYLHTLLAARARGVGVGWVSILEPDVVTRALDVPESWHLIGYLCVGYPRGDDDRRRLCALVGKSATPARKRFVR
jgi:hypothetical protein